MPISLDAYKDIPVNEAFIEDWFDAIEGDMEDILSHQLQSDAEILQETERIMRRIRSAWERKAGPPLMVILQEVAREEKGSIGFQLQDYSDKLRKIHELQLSREGKLIVEEKA